MFFYVRKRDGYLVCEDRVVFFIFQIFMIDVYDIIRSVNEEKRNKNIHPASAVFSEITAAVSAAVKSEINALVAGRRVVYHRTINSLSFDAVGDDGRSGDEP